MSKVIANRYQVVDTLGEGGMGSVYRVQDLSHGNREVALKVIQAGAAITQDAQLRFKEEFRAMAKLRHPNTLEVFDYGQVDATNQYLTMELVPGRDLSDLCEGQQLPLEQVYSLLAQLLRALGFIHSRLFVHRDIKAENLRVREDGCLKLMDFGLMSQLGIPSNGKLTGTLAYLPPEVPKGGVINASSDLYSTGCLAYQLITGRLPFTGSSVDVLKAHIGEPPVPMRAYRPDVPARLEDIVQRLMAKDQKLRYQSADEVLADLGELSEARLERENREQKQSYLTSSVLIGRDSELQELEKAFGEAKAGEIRSVFVGAPAGVGKSRLVQELLLLAKLNGAHVLHGQCLESGMANYEPLAQALRSLIPLSTPEELQRHGPALVRILPELAEQGIEALPALETGLEKARVNDTVTAWLGEVSDREPLVLFFDDLHWSDQNSLETLNYCLRSMRGRRLFVITTFRNDEAPSSSPIWFTIEEGLTRYLKLTAFNLSQMMLLLQAMLQNLKINSAFCQFLFDSTAGNAFFLTEILRFLMEEDLLVLRDGTWQFPEVVGNLVLPTSVEATVVRRLRQLSPEARALARVASVLGRYQERDMFLVVSGLSEESFFDRLDELIERQFIVRDEERYTFPHDRVREALYENIPEDERRDIHQRCGEYIEQKYPERRDALLNDLAHHFSQGHDEVKAFEYLFEAGNKAFEAGVVIDAFKKWKAAETLLLKLDYPGKPEKLGAIWYNLGINGIQNAPYIAIDALEKLLSALESQENFDRPTVITIYGFLTLLYGDTGQPLKGLERFDHAFGLLTEEGTPHEGLLWGTKAASLWSAGHFEAMADAVERAGKLLVDKELTEPGPIAGRCAYAVFKNWIAFMGVRPDEATRDYGIWAADQMNAPHFHNVLWASIGIWRTWTGRYEEAMEAIETMTQNSRRVASPPYYWAIYQRLHLHWQRGEFEEAKALALRFADLDMDSTASAAMSVITGQIHLALDEFDEAERLFSTTERRCREQHLTWGLMQALFGLAQLAKARGNLPLARQYASEAYSLSVATDSNNPLCQVMGLRLLAEIDLAEGQTADAGRRVEEALAIAARPEQDNLLEQGLLRRLKGEILLASGEQAPAREAFATAGVIFQGLKNRYLLRPISKRLEELQADPARGELTVPVAAEATRESRITKLASRWQASFHDLERSHSTDQELYQEILSACLESMGADEVSLFLLKPTLTWVGSHSRSGPSAELSTNPQLLQDVCSLKRGKVGIDMPSDLQIDWRSNLETVIPSVVVAPLTLNDQFAGVLYVKKNDLLEPYMDEDLEILERFCSEVARLFERHELFQGLANA